MAERHPMLSDGALAAVLYACALVSLYTTFELLRQDPAWREPAKPAIVVSLLAVFAPLALRRRAPLVAVTGVTAAFIAGRIALSPGFPGIQWENYLTVWACWIAVYSAVVYAPRSRTTVLVLAGVVIALLGEILREVVFYKGGAYKGLPLNETFLLVYDGAFLALPLLLGIAVRSRRRREEQLTAQTRELQREREENARRAVLEERVRIARELHDVVAHHVSVMGVQAGAARRVMATRPEAAQQSLASIEASSRQAVLELQRLLGVLRHADQPDVLSPQPDLAQLPELFAQVERGGLSVSLSVEGDPPSLPPTLEVSAYRIIQEALTNAVKHSGGTTASVALAYRPGTLEIEVRDDGAAGGPARTAAVPGGHGLIGMRERVRLHGGHLRAGPKDEGFVVHASFPLNGSST